MTETPYNPDTDTEVAADRQDPEATAPADHDDDHDDEADHGS